VSSAAALRALIEQRFPDAIPVVHRTAQPVRSGIPELDRVLPHGGFPLGKLSLCEPLGGMTALLRATCRATIAAGDRAVWIDGARTIAGAFWRDDESLLIRPECHSHAVRAADELLQCGGFRLVVLTGLQPTDTEAMRLVRAVHGGGGAFITIAPHANMAGLRLTSHIERFHWRFDPFGEPAEVESVEMRIRSRALGWDKHAVFSLPVTPHELRLSLEPGVADRRGLPASRRIQLKPRSFARSTP
jgi:hypothetical protein